MGLARFAIGLDLGTTGVKALALGHAGEVLGESRADLVEAHDGWQPVAEVERATGAVLRKLMGRVSGEPVALGVSGAMHTLLPTDAAGEPIDAVMTWAHGGGDVETADRDDAAGDALYRRTGCPPGPLYHRRRIPRYRDRLNRSGAASVARWSGLKEHIARRLTGVMVSDRAIASATGLLNLHQRGWDAEALRRAGIADRGALPDLIEPTHVAGRISDAGAAWTGLPAHLPVIAGASDGALANLGAGATTGEPILTVGTSAAVRYLTDRPVFDPHRRTWCYIADDARFLVGAAMNNAGYALQCIIDETFPETPAEQRFERAMQAAAAVPVGCDGLLCLPFVTGERDLIWPGSVELEWIGLDAARHGPGHRVRAAMEAIALMIRAMWQAVDPPGSDQPVCLTGGITRSPGWMQILADATELRLTPTEAGDASVRGAAMLAWRGVGAADPEPPQTNRRAIAPDPAPRAAYQRLFERFGEACRQRGAWRGPNGSPCPPSGR